MQVRGDVAQRHVHGPPCRQTGRQGLQTVRQPRVEEQAPVRQGQGLEHVRGSLGDAFQERDGRHDGDVGIVQPDRRVRAIQEDVLRIRRDDDPQVDVAVRTGEPVRVAAAHPCGEHSTGHVGCERLFETVHRSIPNDSR